MLLKGGSEPGWAPSVFPFEFIFITFFNFISLVYTFHLSFLSCVCVCAGRTCSSGSAEQISPAKWKSMEEETFHTISHKLSLTPNLTNLEVGIAGDGGKNIDSIDEEIIQASNHVDDDFYGVV